MGLLGECHLKYDNGVDSISATYTRAEGEEYSAILADNIESLNPNLRSTSFIYPQCTLSNAFSVSNDRSREGIPPALAVCIMFRSLLVASEVCLPWTKPVWSALIKREKSLEILFANNLAYSFRSVLRREMGLKFWGVSGSFPGLVKATTIADNISLGKLEEEAASLKRF